MKNRKNKKKKGFTLIELVIVLAVLAIIALIAIPNFTKVRNDSLKKADIESCNQIQKITLMAIANGDIVVKDEAVITVMDNTGVPSSSDSNKVQIVGEGYKDYLKDVKKPQYKAAPNYQVKITKEAMVTVTTSAVDPASPNK